MATITNQSTGNTARVETNGTPIVAGELPLDLDQLVRRCMGRIELVDRLLASFEDRFPKELSQIEECLVTGDVEHLARLTHQLKGAAANVSASSLHAITTKMEESARAHQLDDVVTCLTDVRLAFDRFKVYKASIPRVPTPPSVNRRS
jgi:HPt (histidine-containing phosphotransfer) domain-containing protein